jgi:hypothetical protein
VVKVMPLVAGFIALGITGAKISELRKGAAAEGHSGGAVEPVSSL